jgi:hypothetical protein
MIPIKIIFFIVPHWIDAHGNAAKIGSPDGGEGVNVTNWPKGVFNRSRIDTK